MPKPPSFSGFIRLWDFLFEQAVGKLVVDLAHQLSFYLDLPVLIDYLKMCKFITCWSLEAVHIEKS